MFLSYFVIILFHYHVIMLLGMKIAPARGLAGQSTFSLMMNFVPMPSSLSATIVPLWSFTIL